MRHRSKRSPLLTLCRFCMCAIGVDSLAFAEESPPVAQGNEQRLLSRSRQLTFAGKRAGEGYFSADGSKLIFQSERDEANPFFQIFLMDLDTGDTQQISPGTGKTTCAWVHPGGEKVLFASTHADQQAETKQQAELKDRLEGTLKKYSWDYDENFEIWESGVDGSNLKNLTNTQGYDAEGSYSPDGQWIAFASNRHAYGAELSEEDAARFETDQAFLMDIYVMRADGGAVKRLTEVKGYDGGPFFSADGTKICWRRFNEKGDLAEIWTMNVDGSDQRQLTRLGAMSWAPYFHPSGEYLIFTTNLNGFANFELYIVDTEGKQEPVRVTTTDGFDGLPAFSPDGRKLTWTSNRTSNKTSQIFFADWDHVAALALLKESKEVASAPMADAVTLPETEPGISGDDILKHITYLASEKLQGRLTGTEGEKLATEYVAAMFKKIGLVPAGDDGTSYDPFEFTAGVDLGPENSMALGDDALDQDVWRPLSFSQTGEITPSEIVFAGYGLDVPESTTESGEKLEMYSSYVHLDVKGKWVMMFRYIPEGLTPEQRQRFARHSSLRYKAMTARQKFARGIIVVSGPNAQVKSELVPLGFDASMAGSGIAAISVTNAFAEKLLAAQGKDLKTLQDQLDTGEMASGFAVGDGKLGGNIDIQHEKKTGRNVVATLSSGPINVHNPAIVIGAHVDHLGPNAGTGSLARDEEKQKIHAGADDNASGVAGMLEIAEYLAAQQATGKIKLKRDVIFAAWSGEEIGLLGSSHFTKEAAKFFGDENARLNLMFGACLNLDMIGRLNKTLVLQGVGSSDFWTPEVEKRNVPVGLPLMLQEDSYIPTDATSFYLKGVPILSAFTGAHEDYHTPRDTVDKINLDGARDVSKLMALIARSLATGDTLPEYKVVELPQDRENRAQLRVYLGTIPDYAQGDVKGVKLSGVTAGAPAAKAGVQVGDVIVELAGKAIENIYDYTFVLGAMKVAQETEITVLRNDEKITMKILPGSRD
ncbi:MAG: M20/M25/M40 family metallo-hydrolase [Verrucomicrobia bacterium]|nr:M20/M25/M40 family metallo-hydrolase [Verrucomicrobiota bacterium]